MVKPNMRKSFSLVFFSFHSISIFGIAWVNPSSPRASLLGRDKIFVSIVESLGPTKQSSLVGKLLGKNCNI